MHSADWICTNFVRTASTNHLQLFSEDFDHRRNNEELQGTKKSSKMAIALIRNDELPFFSQVPTFISVVVDVVVVVVDVVVVVVVVVFVVLVVDVVDVVVIIIIIVDVQMSALLLLE